MFTHLLISQLYAVSCDPGGAAASLRKELAHRRRNNQRQESLDLTTNHSNPLTISTSTDTLNRLQRNDSLISAQTNSSSDSDPTLNSRDTHLSDLSDDHDDLTCTDQEDLDDYDLDEYEDEDAHETDETVVGLRLLIKLAERLAKAENDSQRTPIPSLDSAKPRPLAQYSDRGGEISPNNSPAQDSPSLRRRCSACGLTLASFADPSSSDVSTPGNERPSFSRMSSQSYTHSNSDGDYTRTMSTSQRTTDFAFSRTSSLSDPGYSSDGYPMSRSASMATTADESEQIRRLKASIKAIAKVCRVSDRLIHLVQSHRLMPLLAHSPPTL